MVNFGDYGTHEATIFERSRLPPDFAARGPMIVEEATSTTMVMPDQRLRVDDHGFLHITRVALNHYGRSICVMSGSFFHVHLPRRGPR